MVSVLIAAWVAAIAGGAAAAPPTADSGAGDVAVGGEYILKVRFPEGGMSVQQRADAITERLTTILSRPHLKPSDIRAVPMGKRAAEILVGKTLLVTVDEQTARYNGDTPMQLAQAWASRLQRVLPEINVMPNPNVTGSGSEKPAAPPGTHK